MIRPLRILVATDSFPPNCGGSGWSTWELVRGLRARGHHVEVVMIALGDTTGIAQAEYESVPVTRMLVRAPRLPFVRNVVKNELLWRRLGRYLSSRLAAERFDIVHAQHVMTTVPSIRAGRAAGIPVVATVRDYWPVCYWSDLIYDPAQPALCPACSAGMMTRCVKPRAGAAAPVAWPLIPYMRTNLRTKERELARASAVIAVSSAIARDLAERATRVPPSLLHTIPNPIDMEALDRAHDAAPRQMDEPYVLYAGKLATNKGVQYLLRAIQDAGITLPLVIVGDGPLRATMEAEAKERGIDLRVLGWRGREEVWAWMRHATLLAFPSYGPESLSRVLIEAAALGVPIAAMRTGGTGDILRHDVSGLLSDDPAGFSRHLARLAADSVLRTGLGAAARADVHARFAATAVVVRIEQVYRQLLEPVRG